MKTSTKNIHIHWKPNRTLKQTVNAETGPATRGGSGDIRGPLLLSAIRFKYVIWSSRCRHCIGNFAACSSVFLSLLLSINSGWLASEIKRRSARTDEMGRKVTYTKGIFQFYAICVCPILFCVCCFRGTSNSYGFFMVSMISNFYFGPNMRFLLYQIHKEKVYFENQYEKIYLHDCIQCPNFSSLLKK